MSPWGRTGDVWYHDLHKVNKIRLRKQTSKTSPEADFRTSCWQELAVERGGGRKKREGKGEGRKGEYLCIFVCDRQTRDRMGGREGGNFPAQEI